MKNTTLTADRLRELVLYEPETGRFFRRTHTKVSKPGDETGRPRSSGYSSASVDGIKYYAHRVAWLYVHGAWPAGVIDHINGDRSDNRICNLRDVAHTDNLQNVWAPTKKHGRGSHLGVHYSKRINRWIAQIRSDGKTRHIGCFVDEQEAAAAYLAAKRQLHAGFTK